MNIIITGGASGLGKSITETLLNHVDYKFLVSYKTHSALIEQWQEAYPQIQFICCDFTNPQSVLDFVNAIDAFSPDVLINNALASYDEKHFHKTDAQQISSSFNHNVVPVLQLTAKCISIFRKKKLGRIITILSSFVTGTIPTGWSVYTAEKNYLLSMSKSWATENAAFKIVSNCISPEFMLTGLTANTDERIIEQMTAGHPLKQLLTTVEVANVVDFMITCPLHINGINMVINSAKSVI